MALETSLYAAVKAFLEAQGFTAKGEVGGCDIVAVRPGEAPRLVICELKLAFNLELLLQGVDRMAPADEVWLAVPMTRRGRDRDRRVAKLCRLLGIGLLAVDAAGRVEVLAPTDPYRPRANPKRRTRLLREHGRRRGDPMLGGSARTPIMTAYRQRAVECALALRDGSRSTRDLAVVTPEAPGILLRNVYGWFERVSRGVYQLAPAGRVALEGLEHPGAVRLAALEVEGAAIGGA
ncbi:MAG: DUF2161 family putative PD-(D/E)XK-type phosphodiesterase [Acetobacteraceae bacterium]